MKKLSAWAAIVGVVLIVGAGMDSMDEETALFRSGASTEEVLEAREVGEPSRSAFPFWVGGVGIVLLIPWLISKGRNN